MFGSLLDLVEDVVDIVKAPVEVALDITDAVVKPIAEVANDVVDEVKDAVKGG